MGLSAKTLLASLPLILGSPAAFSEGTDTHQFSFGGPDNSEFLLDGKPFQIIGGELHPARIPCQYWRHRIQMAKAMGLNTIPVYVFWNDHEREEGQFDFQTAERNIGEFFKIAKEEGMWVVLRPGPYVCGEWDLGGLPWWLLRTPDIKLRCSDPRFTQPVERYFHELAKIVRPNLCENGGSILMVQIENEYGSYPRRDHDYMVWLRDQWIKEGVKGPFYTADGAGENYLKGIVIPGVAVGLDTGVTEGHFELAHRLNPGVPVMSAEAYPGWLRHWGEGDWKPSDMSGLLKFYMDTRKSFSMYVFHGGTNFGFTAGANGDAPSITSYDYGAPLDEQGCPTPAYHAYRKQLAAYLPAGQSLPEIPALIPTMEIAPIKLARVSGVWEQLGEPVKSEEPQCFEALGQNQGMVVYRVQVPAGDAGKLTMNLHGIPTVYLDGVLQKGLDLPARDKEATLELLVEAMGHINFKGEMDGDRKGILGAAKLNGAALKNWQMFRLPLKEDWAMGLQKTTPAPGRSGGIFKGEFTLDTVADTFLDMSNYRKGVLWVNGHNLGRHWSAKGPQHRLYCPAPWLKKGVNAIVVLDTELTEPQEVAGMKTARWEAGQAPGKLTEQVLFDDKMDGPANNPVWTIHVSPKSPESTFAADNKLGNICTPPDTSVYAEVAWPAGAASVEVTVEAGDDTRSNAWGPGLALMSPGGNLSINVRPGSGKFDVGSDVADHPYDRSRPCQLRVRLDAKHKVAIFDASQDGESFKVIGTAPYSQAPTALRVGKVGHEGVGTDYPAAAATPLIHSKVTRVVIRGSAGAGK